MFRKFSRKDWGFASILVSVVVASACCFILETRREVPVIEPTPSVEEAATSFQSFQIETDAVANALLAMEDAKRIYDRYRKMQADGVGDSTQNAQVIWVVEQHLKPAIQGEVPNAN